MALIESNAEMKTKTPKRAQEMRFPLDEPEVHFFEFYGRYLSIARKVLNWRSTMEMFLAQHLQSLSTLILVLKRSSIPERLSSSESSGMVHCRLRCKSDEYPKTCTSDSHSVVSSKTNTLLRALGPTL